MVVGYWSKFVSYHFRHCFLSTVFKATAPTPSAILLAAFFIKGLTMRLPVAANDNVAGHKLLTFPELKSVKGIPFTRRHIARLEDNGAFPARVNIGQHRVGWIELEIDQHIAEKIAARPPRKNAMGATLH
jgi:predicted DNA-binding transcriptional regulator AlpA